MRKNEDLKRDVFKTIKNCRSLVESKKIKIEDYVNAFPDLRKEDKVTYGVNVRISKDSDSDVYPFSFSKPYFKPQEVTEYLKDGLKIPDFLNKLNLKEAIFRADFRQAGDTIEITYIKGVLTDNCFIPNPFKDSREQSEIDKAIFSFFSDSQKTFLHGNIQKLNMDKEGSVYVWVCGEDPDVSQDGDCNYLTNVLAIANDSNLLKKIMTKRNDILEFVMLLKSRRTEDSDKKQKKEAIKSAKAAIMSRNMSHNLGSHVMSYLKQKLGSITSILNEDNDVLSNLYNGKELNGILFKEDDKCPTIADKIKKNIQMPFLVGTGRFIGYLQERQDYIATIATDYIPYGAPVNLKDAIYDEINPDLRHMRHNDADNNRPLNILLSYIAKSEGLSRENMGKDVQKKKPEEAKTEEERKEIEAEYKLKRFRTENDILFGYVKYSKDKEKVDNLVFGFDEFNNDSDHPALSEMRTVNFSLPGGLVGRQALFSIFENLIRNAAKHGNTRNVKNLEFTLDVIDLNHINDCVNIERRITDKRYRDLYENAIDKENLYLLTITDNLIYNDDVIDKLRKGLGEPYIDKFGNMTTGNKGIKEIRISAAWLRYETDEDKYLKYSSEVNKGKAPLVGVELTTDKHLRYMICIQQDRFAAVITEKMDPEAKEFFKQLSEEAPNEWKLYKTSEEAKRDYKISYRYMIVSNDDVYKNLRPFTSNRLINCGIMDIKSIKHRPYIEKKDSILQSLYNKNNSKSEPIYIWDGNAFDAHKEERETGSIPEEIKLSSSDADENNAKYVYRTHHSNEKDFYEYWNKKIIGDAYNKVVCIDAVTGENSSDRIVRREPLNREWYYSHLYAMKKRIAIFDERIFKIVHNIDENQFISSSGSVKRINDLISTIETSNKDVASIKEKCEKVVLIPDSEIDNWSFAENTDEVIRILNKQKTVFNPQYSNNYKSVVFKEKGIDVFTIIEEDKGVFAVVGCVNVRDVSKDDNHIKYDKIATISAEINGDDINVKIIPMPEYKSFINYDYISIHQGILDKMYEGLGIKRKEIGENEEEKDIERVNNQKIEVTNSLYKHFSDPSKAIGDYLPCFIVHSGRAKPTIEDMPQKLPFIQYAAIENAVLDCKYALVELLDYARYEPNNEEDFL